MIQYYCLVAIETKDGKPGGKAASDGRADAATHAWTLLQHVFFSQRPRSMEIFREHELVPPHWIALQALDEPMPMGELAKVLVCDNSNVTWIVDRLEDRGLVERQAAPHDRRVKLLVLTGKGRRLRDEIQAELSEPPDAIRELSRDDVAALRRILKRVAAALEAA